MHFQMRNTSLRMKDAYMHRVRDLQREHLLSSLSFSKSPVGIFIIFPSFSILLLWLWLGSDTVISP